MIYRHLWAGCCLLLLWACHSPRILPSPTPGEASPPAGFRPAVLSPAPGDTSSRPLPFHRLSVTVAVSGNLARTTLEAEVYNPYDRPLAGTFVLPLQENQTPSRFALEVDGSLREAVVVEKNRARQVFEAVVRQGIDPGLLEWVRGNHFRARIFPIPARGYKRFVVAFEQELRPVDDDLLYLLPLAIPDTLATLDLRVTVHRNDLPPQPYQHELETLTFAPWQEAYVAEQHLSRVTADKQLGFRIPGAAQGDQVFLDTVGGETYFYLLHRPQRFLKEAEPPQLVTLLWDNSRSMQGRDLEAELRLLDAYFRALDAVEVELVDFHYEARSRGRFRIEGGDWSRLQAVLRRLTPDGGTRLTALELDRYPGEAFLLFTDGLSLAEYETLRPARAPLTIVSSAQSSDHSRLRQWAQAQGGQYLPLTQLSVPEALTALRFQPYRFLGATYDSTAVTDTWPREPGPVGETFALAGKLLQPQGELYLHFGYGQTIIRTETIRLSPAVAQPGGGMLPRLWAHRKLAALQAGYDRHRAEILALGQAFGIVTPQTSLLVLDRVEDYVAYQVPPPPALRPAYDALMAQRKETRRVELLSHLDQVAEDYFARRQWWETRFKVPQEPYAPDSVRPDRETLPDQDSDGVPDVQDDWGGSMDLLIVEEDAPAPEPAAPARPEPGDRPARILLLPWNPETPYLDSLRRLSPGELYGAYLLLSRRYGEMPAYYLDVADLFLAAGDSATGLRVLSNLAELDLDNPELLRTLARRLGQLGRWDLAQPLFQALCHLRPDEPQSYRDLGLTLARRGAWQAAVDTLWSAIQRPWPDRFPGIGALMTSEMNALIARSPQSLRLDAIDSRLRYPLPSDLRVILEWDANDVDMDLWVTDPRGEKCYYQHQRTAIGGWMSPDFTGGYGPEEFWLRQAMPGRYRIQVNYYGQNRASLTGPVHVQLRLITAYGQATQQEQAVTLRLSGESEVLEVGEMVVD